MQYIEMLDRIFRVQDNTRSIRDGHQVVDVKNQGVYILRRAQYTNTYLLQRVGDLADTQTVYRIKTLDLDNPHDQHKISVFTSSDEFSILTKATSPYGKDIDLEYAINALVQYNYESMENKKEPAKPKEIIITHQHIKKLRIELDLPDEAVSILNDHALHVHYNNENERPIPCAGMDTIIQIKTTNLDEFDKFIVSLSEYVKIKHLRNITTRYHGNSYVTQSNEWKSSKNTAELLSQSIFDGAYETLYVELLLMSTEGKSQTVCFKVGRSLTITNAFDILNYACKITPMEPKYRFAGLEKYIDECKTRVLGDKYNRKLQYTTLTGVL